MISYQTILANGGATVGKNGEAVALRSGYQVSKQDVAVIAVRDFKQEDVENDQQNRSSNNSGQKE